MLCGKGPELCNDKAWSEEKCLLSGFIDLSSIYIDELHLFLRLWDLIIDIFLGHVEFYDKENDLTEFANIIGITFYVLDGMDKDGYQMWTPLQEIMGKY